ncbi:MAG: hypothetical protein OXD33_01195 [Rhodobacteraceae bacterium]|nr:hypothetical protein [Paracoccaceae bacterium]
MTKFVLIGAGSLQFGTGMLGDIFSSPSLSDAEIILHDINETAAKRVLAIAQQHIESKHYRHQVRVEPDLGRALQGAEFIVISIEVGDRFKLWDLDWKLPQQYGVTQIFGENGGAGGLFHALRIIPPILDICGKVMEMAPTATVFNFSNPMSRICTAVHRKFPNLKFIGMCHEVASLERHLPPMLGVARSDIHYRAGGLNHFSVLTEVTYCKSGKSALEDVMAAAPDYFRRLVGYSELLSASQLTGKIVDTEGWMAIDTSHVDTLREWSDRFLFREMIRKFGALPITSDSHFGEYIQWAHDCADHRGILDFYQYYRESLSHREARIREGVHERAVPIIEAILTGTAYEEAAVNIPNGGFIADLPPWMVVEVPAMIDAAGIHGLAVEVPSGIRGLLTNQIGVHDLTVQAVLEKSREMAVQALLVDPVITVSRGLTDLVDHMIAVQSPYLDYLS